DLDDVADTSRKQVEALQERALALAAFAAATAMAPLPRLARDLCRELSKQASLVVDDGDVELDKQVLERIAEPLRALVINALDHGVESPDERSAAGKDPTATVSITARQRGGQVVIEVSDDGRGVDVDAVRRRGVAAGWLSGEEEISAADLGGLLFRPGFSTAQQSTTTSGRGVGLDIVRDAIDALKGGIEVYTEAGSGTTFVLTVPTTLSIVVGVTVVSGGRTYALPVSAVSEVVQVPADEIRTVAGRDVVDLRGEVLPLVSLSGLIGGDADREGGPVMVLSSAGRSLAVRVENLVGQREIVVKNLGSFVRGVRHVGGASILGNGEVILVLDPSSLLAAGRLGSAARVPGPSHHQAAANPRVLVVDDAAPIREMVRAILEAAGFDVTTAADGVEALAGYEHETAFDAVVSDVQMPQMDGLELCAALRERGVTVPIVMLTSLGSDDDRRRGLDAGADAYLTKADFDQVELVELLRSMVPA
ncbi:MAG: response regulator, partial [Acidimicrobiia bacterium]|nr:response regulator [Acidimicrobiia bacterium]